MTEDAKLGFIISNVAKRAARDDTLDVDFAVQSALAQFDKGRFANRPTDNERFVDDDGLNFDVGATDDGLF